MESPLTRTWIRSSNSALGNPASEAGHTRAIRPRCGLISRADHVRTACLYNSEANKSPGPDLPSFGIALVDREMARIEQVSKADRKRPGSADEEIAVLDMAKKVISLISPSSLFLKASRPALWHTDLHMGNIFVSDTDPTQIVSLIDWQSIVISPLLLQARFPEFLSVGPSSSYEFGMDFPQLPQDFDSIDEQGKKIIEFKHVQAKMAKGYELATGGYNIEGYRALSIPFSIQELFLRCGDASDEGTVPLRNCLVEVLEGWHDLGFINDAPFTFDQKTLHKHSQDLEKYRNIHKVREIARDALCTDSEGWIAPQLDFKVKQLENKALIEYAMAHSVDYNMTPEEIYSIWPFKDI